MKLETEPVMETISPPEKVLRNLKEYIEKLILNPDAIEEIYHYTTIEALFSGILVNEAIPSKEICLRASDARYMNDPTELKVGWDFLESISEKSLGDKDALSSFYKGFTNSYIVSFSSRRDSLMMWHMYGKNATGVSLRFDLDKMQEDTKDSMLRCVYFTNEMSDQIKDYLKELSVEKELKEEGASWAFLIYFIQVLLDQDKAFEKMWSNLMPLLKFALSLKSPAYEDEQEIRLLIPQQDEKEAVKYQLRNNLIVPYIEHYIPKEALQEVIVGPNNDMPRTIISIQDYLKHMGLEHVKVSPSFVPYRGC